MTTIVIKHTFKELIASFCSRIVRTYKMAIVAAFGNPLLDISVRIQNDEILKKFNLNEDGQSDVPEDVIHELYKNIEKLQKELNAGGCAQNTSRVLQWLLGVSGATVFFGGIGNDKQGRLLEKLVQDAGVQTKYLVNEKSTGTCIALVKNPTRTLVAHLGAAELFNQQEFITKYLNILKTVQICYMEGYFITKRIQVAEYIREFCRENQILFVFNLSGAYLFKKYGKEILDFAQKCDMLFGNYGEFSELGKTLNIDNPNPKNVAVKLNKDYFQQNPSECTFGKSIIVTNGAKKVFCVYRNSETLELNVPRVPKEEVRDTTGAGDSFVAGFLAGYVKKFPMEQCVKLAFWTSGQIIRQTGCAVPNFQPNIENILENCQ